MNITLSADEALIARVRAYAKRHNSSLNSLVRAYLEQLVDGIDGESAASEFERLCDEFAGESPDGYRFNRKDAYLRGPSSQ